MNRHPVMQAINTAEAWCEDMDTIMARAIIRPDPANPSKGNIRRAVIGITFVCAAIAATVLFAGA